MKALVLHSEIVPGATVDEQDVLVQHDAVREGLTDLGWQVGSEAFTLDLNRVIDRIEFHRPDLVFNLVETLAGSGRLIHVAPALLDHLRLPYSGCPTEAIFLTSNKLLAKDRMRAAGIATPAWIPCREPGAEELEARTAQIIKSVWEHASIGLDQNSVLIPRDRAQLSRELCMRRKALGGDCFAERYVEGREFNLSIIEEGGVPRVLPPAEIVFEGFQRGEYKVVGYRAKWMSDSREYEGTRRRFDFSASDDSLLKSLERIAIQCWRLFGLSGYARVDFRIDDGDRPWVLEVNTNPCLAPDAGFLAAAGQAGLLWGEVLGRIVKAALRRSEVRG